MARCSWTCVGQVEECTPELERKSVKRVERNLPALSECSVPTRYFGSGLPWFRSAAKEARNLRTCIGACDLEHTRYAALNREWSSTTTSA
eukprot:6175935-Pleurochrysis_carterae.AAC.2